MQVRRALLALMIASLCLSLAGCGMIQRKFLFYPSHHNQSNGLTPWGNNEEIIGYSREVPDPQNVWLMLHGNAGQAADRAYALSCFSKRDSVFILEYPGYGLRDGHRVPKAKLHVVEGGHNDWSRPGVVKIGNP